MKNLYYSIVCCCIVFGENAISLNVGNGGQQIENKHIFSKI